MKKKNSWSIIAAGFVLGLMVLGSGYWGWQQQKRISVVEKVSRFDLSLNEQNQVSASLEPTKFEIQAPKVNTVQTQEVGENFSVKSNSVQDFLVDSISYNVPFTAQAPFGDWDDPLQQDGCEEASALMAVSWAKSEPITSLEKARDTIVAAGEWQQQKFPTGVDTSAQDTADRIIQQYFDWPYVEFKSIANWQQIVIALHNDALVITPMNGQKLGNPYFTGDGPERHMLVVIGYDADSQEFITNDPGTRHGKGYRYDVEVFWNAIRDYATGDHESIVGEDKVMIVVAKTKN